MTECKHVYDDDDRCIYCKARDWMNEGVVTPEDNANENGASKTTGNAMPSESVFLPGRAGSQD